MSEDARPTIETLRDALAAGESGALRDLLTQCRAEDLAEAVGDLPMREVAVLLDHLSPEALGEVLVNLDSEFRDDLLENLDAEAMAGALEALPAEDAADLVEQSEHEVVEEALRAMDEAAAGEIRKLLAYPPESAGGIMAPDAFALDGGGNSGSQAATLIVRSLATGDVRPQHYVRLLLREFGVSLTLGLTMAVAVYMVAYFVRGDPEVALAVSISMVCIVVIGSLIGMSLPFVLHAVRLDPATASAPLVTSVADISGVLIYLGIANAILGLVAET